MRVQNGIVLTMEGAPIPCGYIDFADGIITGCGHMENAPPYSGEVLDAKGGYILPGFIDAHTHIGISEEGLRWEGEDCNETTSAVTAEMRVTDGFNPFDTAIAKARRAGVTAAGVAPGSTNVIGGQIAVVKLVGKNIDDMIVRAPAAIKFALGENPKRNYGNAKGSEPMTRMAIAAVMRRTLEKAKRYATKKKTGEDIWDDGLEPLLPLLRGEIPAHFHAHRADDILTAIRIAKEFGLSYSILHATDAEKIADLLAESGTIPVVGPSMGPAGKPETQSTSFATCARLYEAGAEVAITTDHDVTPLWLLPMFTAMCIREGLPEEAALRAITINAAKTLGVDDRIGSLNPGKDADIVIYDGHPFHYMTKPIAIFINGEKVS